MSPKINCFRKLFDGWIGIAVYFFLIVVVCAARIPTDRLTPEENVSSFSALKLQELHNNVVLDNGIVRVTLVKPGGLIAAIGYRGIDNVLQYHSKETQRGYWDINWKRPDNGRGSFDTLRSPDFKFSVVAHTEDQIEVSFKRTWNVSHDDGDLPLNIDKRYVVLRGSSGFYSYAVFEHLEGWPALKIDSMRLTMKLRQDMFNYMAISDERQRIMPTARDRLLGRSLDYKEAVLLTDPANPELKGEVDDKYQYSCNNQENRVHGWISSRPHVGFWMITPSDEFLAGSPFKPDLTSHVGPTTLAMFLGGHYNGPDFGVDLLDGEPWKKVLGPVFIYLNSDSGNERRVLWEDAKKQLTAETMKWPYEFPISKDFPPSSERGSISGRLHVRDRYLYDELMPAGVAHVGLAPPGAAGSWQHDAKGYQFWTKTDENGYFNIRGVRAGTYNLYAWIPGIIGDYKHENDIIIRPGNHGQLGDFVYNPPRSGPTLWEIGIPDRSAAEFFIPDPSPNLTNKLYINTTTEKFRQYGLWDRYTDLYPTKDLIYVVGESNYHQDWFFAHVTRKEGHNYVPTQWQISFDITNLDRARTYTLRMALASANLAEIQVRVNEPNARRPHFTTRRVGRDNAIARHGIHGVYWLYSVNISGFQLKNGRNTIYLRQARGNSPFTEVMYDYLRLEGP